MAWSGVAGTGTAWQTTAKQPTTGGSMKLTAEAINELKAIEDRRGRLTPEQVLEVASDPKSALHPCFEWDDSTAAHGYRIEQARELLTRVRIEIEYEQTTIRTVGYVRDPVKAAGEAGYANLMKVRKQDATELMRQEVDRVLALLERVVGIAKAKAVELPGGYVAGLDRVVKLLEGII